MKKVFIRFIVLAIVNSFWAQQIPDRKVFSTAGRDLKNLSIGVLAAQNNRVTFTMGEPIIGLITLSGKRLNIGFIQPDGVSPISPPSPVQIMVNDPFFISPNPVTNYTIIKAPEQWEDKVNIQLMDINGRLVKSVFMDGLVYELYFQDELAPGNYYLNFYKEDGSFLQQSKLIKMNKQ